MTPLLCAVLNGNGAIANALLEQGANARAIDKRGRTALHHAARMLLEWPQADPNAEDRKGHTPLSLAELNRHEGVIRLLQAVK